MAAKIQDSEFHAYAHIKDELKDAGWDTRNPARNSSGQVYTQNECHSHPEIKTYLALERPENVVKVTDSVFWVIEAKPYHNMLPQAVSEAEQYATKISISKNVKA